MRRIEDDCVNCDIPCCNCGLKHVEHIYCDNCGEELTEDELYQLYDSEYCEECYGKEIKNKFTKDLYLKYLIKYNDIDAYNEIKDGGNWKEYLEEEDLNLLFSFANEYNSI